MKKTIFIVTLFSSLTVFANSSKCMHCTSSEALIADIFSKKIKCEPLNNSTAELQERFVEKGTKIVNLLVNEPQFSEEQATSILKLSSLLAAYDTAISLPQDIGISRFKKKSSFFKKAGESLVQKKIFSQALLDQTFEYLGLIPSKDRLESLKCPIE
jgi:hypothetical protein